MRAKTADERAAEQLKTWMDGIAKTFGFITDDVPADVPPEQRAEQLASQLASAQDSHRAAQVELAIWKGAAQHDANPGRLTDSRAFMAQVAKLDPAAADFETQLAAAIGTAVAGDQYYRNTPPAGQAPPAPVLPPVPSGGDFAGGPSGAAPEPQSVDDYRQLLRAARAQARGQQPS
jgi:hypothetical protein